MSAAPADPAFATLPAPRRWDCAALGEVMLRLDPGEERIRAARQFRVWEGGGEYNVARGLRKTFGRPTVALTALPRNELGLLAEDLILQGGCDTRHLVWRDYDGIGRNTRMGLNFTERGFGVRAALGVSDRAYSAAAQLRPEEFAWPALFGDAGARWLHTGGIFAALSESTAQTAIAAVQAARRHGALVSYDLNYRASLWNSHPDPDAARHVNQRIVAECDLLIGDEYSFAGCLGLDMRGVGQRSTPMDPAPAEAAARLALQRYPQLQAVAFPLRDAHSASRNHWAGVLHTRQASYRSVARELDILDRVGGGDAFVSGLIHGLLCNAGPQAAIDYAAAHGALAMTTPGDNAMVAQADVEALMRGEGAAARR
ncbi:sugar kinase [Xanthomonas sp. NCPPB 2654]|uniref:sugar kinase n=1 Tax=unclassified Xanthomonas TaxID=2643310 RepID=UPI0021E07716|nr:MULTISPECIES: sugar kinase [unclassified Xanthomonas]MDL5364631.1 sugar kinase [Xanthomonas sp. NCPPB 2654]UYC21945.1 sugar kinase [Xanthomonas sp. CFBP 8443]